MVDFHTHILPGMDDGAKTASEGVRMLSAAYNQGVRLCVATPHFVLHKNDDIEPFLIKRERQKTRLLEAAGSRPLPAVRLGAELYMDNNPNQFPDIEKLCIEGSRCLLVEFPAHKYNPYWGDWLHSLTLKGIVPVIAHFDRYVYADEMLSDFVGVSVVYQINASRLFSFGGRRRLSALLQRALPVVMGSDMHNTSTRPCNMQGAFRCASRKFPAASQSLFFQRARTLLEKGEVDFGKIAY